VKIIGGTYRNRLLKAPKSDTTRPTLAILRKAVFDILQPTIADATFLDLFAGSGLMGLEALSRGAAHATFVEKDRAALRTIKENVSTLKVQDQCAILALDALRALHTFAKKKQQFDIIYMDPPYANAEQILPEYLLFIDAHALLAPGGTLFLEARAPATPPGVALAALHFVNSRTFSDTILHQYRREKKF
jgi:16S rRNA (guanine(966)-N(2))-methyltransferase RsmD